MTFTPSSYVGNARFDAVHPMRTAVLSHCFEHLSNAGFAASVRNNRYCAAEMLVLSVIVSEAARFEDENRGK
jgi:hypothetical protein